MAKALSVKNNKRGMSGCLLWGFFGLFFCVGVGIFYLLAVRPFLGVMSASDWAETDCTVISSDVARHQGEDGPTYSIEITYNYTVNGQQHTSDRYSFMGDFSSSGFKGKKAVVDKYPAGQKARCFVDPDDPDSAVLNREFTSEMWWGLFPIPFMLVGGGGLAWLILGKFRSTKNATETSEATAGSVRRVTSLTALDADEVVPGKRDDDDLPAELEAETSPGCRLMGTLGAAIFWNGLVSVFVYNVVFEDFELLPALFMIPFVCVGIFLIGAVVYYFIALFNPRPTVTLSRGSVPLGGTATVSWRFSGNTNAIQRLTISIRAQEEATYRRGTDTHTDTETIYEDLLIDAQGMMAEVAEGSVEFTVPANGMHSFEADNNEINWELVLHGDIPMRPDVKVEFPIRVRPHE